MPATNSLYKSRGICAIHFYDRSLVTIGHEDEIGEAIGAAGPADNL